MDTVYEKRGYLEGSFRLFHIDEPALPDMEYHYHEFHKILILIKGTGRYFVEGKHYALLPYDIILVPSGCVHRPELDPGQYERIVIYLSPEYLSTSSDDGCRLDKCFQEARSTYEYILRPTEQQRHITMDIVWQLEAAVTGVEYGDELLSKLLVMQLMIELGRGIYDRTQSRSSATVYDEKTVGIIKYINENLTGDITIDDLAERFFVSKFHMMRSFKAQTGYSIHSYISNKRLLMAREQIKSGAAATNACYACGFRDYSTFSRAYKKQWGQAPTGKRDERV